MASLETHYWLCIVPLPIKGKGTTRNQPKISNGDVLDDRIVSVRCSGWQDIEWKMVENGIVRERCRGWHDSECKMKWIMG